MSPQIVHLDPIRVVMYKHTGPYEELSAVFDELWEWVNSHSVPADRTIGIYWDNPDFTPARRLRSAACVEIPSYYVPGDTAHLPISVEQIAGGSYVTDRFVGPYEDLAPVWTNLTNYVEKTLGRKISGNPAFEVYVNDASDTPPAQLITELYMPII